MEYLELMRDDISRGRSDYFTFLFAHESSGTLVLLLQKSINVMQRVSGWLGREFNVDMSDTALKFVPL